MNNGYNEYKMSNRAVNAYENGEMPLSKWNKKVIINAIEEYIENNNIKVNFDINNINKYSLDTLKRTFLYRSSWHHTSSKFNKTDFYQLDEDSIIKTNESDLKKLEEIIKEEKVEKEKEKEKSNYEYVIIEYEEFEGSKKYGKYVNHSEPAILIGNWAYLIKYYFRKPEKKNIDGNHILNIKKFGTRKPKEFNTELVKKIKKELGI